MIKWTKTDYLIDYREKKNAYFIPEIMSRIKIQVK